MELDILKQNTTWNDASASINNNFAKVKTALEQGGGGADLTEVNKKIAALTEETERLEADKQDVLVSGSNIKTINGQSILGVGNIAIEGGGGSITLDTEMSDTSTNAVSNKTIKKYVDDEVEDAKMYAEEMANNAETAAKKYTDEKIKNSGGGGGTIDESVLDLYTPLVRDFSDDFNNDFTR